MGEYVPLGNDFVGLGGWSRIEWMVLSGFVKAAYISLIGRIRPGVVRNELRVWEICHFEAKVRDATLSKREGTPRSVDSVLPF